MMNRLFLSFFGSGYLRPASGTWGSLAALPAAYVVYSGLGPYGLVFGVALFYALGVAVIGHETRGGEDHDPSWIVIDEVVGQWIALLPVAFGAASAGLSPLALWPGILVAFFAFRLFDIWKPWIIGRADRRGDPAGVMLDDVWAGLFAAVVVVLLAALAHLTFVSSLPGQP